MSLIRFARDGVIRLPLGDQGDYLEVKEEISKGTFRAIMQAMPQKELDTSKEGTTTLTLTQGEAVDYQCALFEAMVTGWSADVPATVENYLRLDNESASLIDEALGKHFSEMSPSKDELGKPNSSRGTRQKG